MKKSDSLKWSEELNIGEALVDKERTYQKEQSNAIIDKQDVLTAFKYGTKIIPITGIISILRTGLNCATD